MKGKKTGLTLLSLICSATLVIPWSASPSTASASSSSPWVQIWADDFNGANGTGVDTSKWNQEIGNNGGWGNNELEYYTNSTKNAYMDNAIWLFKRTRKICKVISTPLLA